MAKVLWSTSAAKIRKERKIETDKRLDQFVFCVIIEIKAGVNFFGKRKAQNMNLQKFHLNWRNIVNNKSRTLIGY